MKAQNKFAIQEETSGRYAAYRSMVREQFAARASVLLIVPRVSDAEKVYQELSRGIEEYAFLFHSRIPWKKLRNEWAHASLLAHPILVVGTPLSLALPRKDIGLFILEDEYSPAYRTLSRPFFDIRYFTEQMAEAFSAKFVAGGSFLRVETLHRHEEHELLAREPLHFRFPGRARRSIIDVKKEAGGNGISGGFRIISPSLEAAIGEHLLAPGEGNIFLYGVRRGLAPLTLCRDCGTVVSCKRCSSPVVLHLSPSRQDTENIFLCHKCGSTRSALEKCVSCAGWRLESFGIGIEAAVREATELFPKAEIFELHSDAVKSDTDTKAIVQDFLKRRGAILIGTEKALPYLPNVALSGILSLDPLFLLPDFRMRERILHNIFEISSKTSQELLIQTRRPEEEVFSTAIRGDILEFFQTEMRERKRFHYPPFSVIIKISWTGKEEDLRQKNEKVRKIFERWEPRIFPAFTQKVKNRYRIHCLLKIPKKSWPDNALLRTLFSLSPDFQVEADPKDLL